MREPPSDHEDRIRALEDAGGGGGVTDHGALTGLADDDHPQYALDTDLSDHVAAADPHTGYQKESEKGAASGYASLDGSTKVPYAQLPTGDVASTVAIGDHDHAGVYAPVDTPLFTRATVTITTASLANGATENSSTGGLPVGYRLIGFDSDRACRVRLYTTAACRTADASRAVGTDVDIASDHGLVFEYVAAAATDVNLSPLVDGFIPSPETDVFYAIENTSGATSTVAIILDYIRTE